LTDAEHDFIRRFDLTDAGFRRGKKAYEEQEGSPEKPSSWDSVLTIDSAKRKRQQREAALAKKGAA
jgi:hypothetical protein